MHKKHTKKLHKPARKRNGATPLKINHSGVSHKTQTASDETDVRLKFRHAASVTATGPLYSKSFTPNAAYDVDPALGSTETFGFDEYAALYSYYRVISYSYVLRMGTNGSTITSHNVYVLNTNTTIAGTRFDLFATNPYCQFKMQTPYGNGAALTIRGRHTVSQIVGSRAPETEDNYRAVVNTVPNDLIFLTLAVESLAGSNVAFDYTMDVVMNVRFYGRKYDLSLAAQITRLQAVLTAREEYQLQKKLKAVNEKKC